jgi:hypothetical protein
MAPLVTKLQVATTKSPTVEAMSMLVMMPAKLMESEPELLPVVNSSKVASAVSPVVSTSSMMPALAGGIGVVNQLDSAGAGDQAANERAEGVAVVGDIKGVFGNVQRPAPGANDGCVGSAGGVELNRTFFAAKNGHD